MLVRKWRKGNTGKLLIGIEIGAASMGNGMEVPQKNKSRTTIKSSNSTPGYISKIKMKTLIQKDTIPPMFTEASFTIGKIWTQSKCPSTDEWIKKITHTHTLAHTMEYYLEEMNFAICKNMYGLGGHYAKSDRKRQILYDITYMWNIKHTTN